MSGLIWIQTVWHSDSIPENSFEKVNFKKNPQTTKSMQNYPACKELINCKFRIIALDEVLLFHQKVLIFFLFFHENIIMLWVLIRRISLRQYDHTLSRTQTEVFGSDLNAVHPVQMELHIRSTFP